MQLINQIRGLLAEYGIVLTQHPGQVRRGLPTVLEDAENQLTGASRELFRSLYEKLAELDEKIALADNRIQVAFQNTPNCQRIAAVEGVGPLIATAVVYPIRAADIGSFNQQNWTTFQRGKTGLRNFKCWNGDASYQSVGIYGRDSAMSFKNWSSVSSTSALSASLLSSTKQKSSNLPR